MIMMAEPNQKLTYYQCFDAVKEMLFNDFDSCVKAGFEKLEIRPNEISIQVIKYALISSIKLCDIMKINKIFKKMNRYLNNSYNERSYNASRFRVFMSQSIYEEEGQKLLLKKQSTILAMRRESRATIEPNKAKSTGARP